MLRTLAGGMLFGEVWGQPPPNVVALHGWRRTHTDFSGVLRPTSPGGGLAAVAPDLPGFGATPPPPTAWGSEEYAAAVAALFDREDGPRAPAVVVGHSLGGRVAATLAARHPHLVGALVLCGAPLAPHSGRRSRPSAAFRMLRALHRLGMVGEGRMDAARRRYGSPDYAASEGVMREVLVRLVNETYEEVLAAIRCPVELVWGDQDTEAPLSVAHHLRARLPGAELTVCPGTGHLVPLERPAEIRAAIERALART